MTCARSRARLRQRGGVPSQEDQLSHVSIDLFATDWTQERNGATPVGPAALSCSCCADLAGRADALKEGALGGPDAVGGRGLMKRLGMMSA